MSSTGKSSGYLYRCAEGAESFSVTLTKPSQAEVRQESRALGLQNAITYRETKVPSRNLLLPVSSQGTRKFRNGPPSSSFCLFVYAQNVRSKVRYWIASAMCLGSICAAPS